MSEYKLNNTIINEVHLWSRFFFSRENIAGPNRGHIILIKIGMHKWSIIIPANSEFHRNHNICQTNRNMTIWLYHHMVHPYLIPKSNPDRLSFSFLWGRPAGLFLVVGSVGAEGRGGGGGGRSFECGNPAIVSAGPRANRRNGSLVAQPHKAFMEQ